MLSEVYGYVRVSSKDQNDTRQLIALEEYSVPRENVYIDTQSGKDFDRPAYQRLLRKLEQGDLLVIKSIDRLGRDYDELLYQWRIITKKIQADVFVLDMPLLDTRKQGDDLTGAFIADLVLQILSYVAQAEREAIKQRQKEGIAAAKANGIRFGRKPLPLPDNFEEVCEEYSAGQLTVRSAAKKLSMSASTFHRKYTEFKSKSKMV